MKAALDSLRNYCALLGSNPLLVQGAGGNASLKDENILWVKASGTQLADALSKDIFVSVDLFRLQDELRQKKQEISPEVLNGSKLRPSIETLLHAVMPQKYVMHLHAVDVLAYLVIENCADCLSRLLEQHKDIHWALIDYFKPGFELSEAILAELQKNPDVQLVFLRNHGIVIGGDSIEEIESLLSKLIAVFSGSLTLNAGVISHSPREKSIEQYELLGDDRLNALVLDRNIWKNLQSSWALYPDHIVFLGARPFLFDTLQSFHDYVKTTSDLLPLAFVKNVGIYISPTFTSAQTAQLHCYFDVMARVRSYESIQTLTEPQIAELIDWDAEKYRQNLNKKV